MKWTQKALAVAGLAAKTCLAQHGDGAELTVTGGGQLYGDIRLELGLNYLWTEAIFTVWLPTNNWVSLGLGVDNFTTLNTDIVDIVGSGEVHDFHIGSVDDVIRHDDEKHVTGVFEDLGNNLVKATLTRSLDTGDDQDYVIVLYDEWTLGWEACTTSNSYDYPSD